MKLLSGISLSLIILLSAFLIPTPKKVKLKLNLTKGDKFKMEIVNDQHISQEIMGQKQDVKQKLNFVYSFDVMDKNTEGIATVKVTYLKVNIMMDTPMGVMTYNSDEENENISPALKGFAALAGQSYTLKINNKGKVSDVQGVDKMIDNMLEELDLPDEAQRQTMRESLKNQFGDVSVKTDMEKMLSIYPDAPVKIGDSWSRTNKTSIIMPMAITNTWTLKGVEKNMAMVEIKSEVNPNDEGEPMDMMGMKLSYKISGTQTGTTKINIKSGWTEESSVTQDLQGEVTMSGNPQGQEDMTWPIKIESKVSTKRL